MNPVSTRTYSTHILFVLGSAVLSPLWARRMPTRLDSSDYLTTSLSLERKFVRTVRDFAHLVSSPSTLSNYIRVRVNDGTVGVPAQSEIT